MKKLRGGVDHSSAFGVTLLASLFAFFCVASVYLLPQFLAWHAGVEQSFFLKLDEPAYAARVVRFLQGFWSIGNPWTFEHRADSSLLPPLPEWILGSLAAFLCISVDTLSWLARGLLSAFGTWIFWRLLKGLGIGSRLALVLAVWSFADPGVYNYKPLEALWKGIDSHPFNRFSNPLLGLPLFFWSLSRWARIFVGPEDPSLSKSKKQERVSDQTLILAGVSLGLLFYVSVYYWTHLIGAVGLGFFLVPTSDKKARTQALLSSLLIAALVALPYWATTLRLHQVSLFNEVIWRTGILVRDRAWYLLTHRALWASLLVVAPLFLNRNRGQRFLGASILAGFFCFISSPFTGVSLQNFHWHYTLAPLCLGGGGWSIATFWLKKVKVLKVLNLNSKLLSLWSLILLLALPLVSGWVVGVREFSAISKGRFIGMGAVDQRYTPAWKWLKNNASAQAVVLTQRRVQGLVPVRTGLRIWQDSTVELVPSQEILERNQLLWYLEGLQGQALIDDLAPFAPKKGGVTPKLPVAQWSSGLTSKLLAQMQQRGYPVVDEVLSLELAHRLSEEQSQVSVKKLRGVLERYRLDYWVRETSESNDSWERGLDVFAGTLQLQKVFETPAVQIFKLTPIFDPAS